MATTISSKSPPAIRFSGWGMGMKLVLRLVEIGISHEGMRRRTRTDNRRGNHPDTGGNLHPQL